MSSSTRWRVWGLLALVAFALSVYWQSQPKPSASVPAAPKGGDFSLVSASGPLSLPDFRGKVLLLYFGYTYCPDICPTSLAATAEGIKGLSAADLDKVAVIFVSVDPERDTPERLKEYAAFFHPKVLGATAAPAVIAELAGRYGVFYARQKVDTAGGGYVIDHTSETYVIGPDGVLKTRIPHAAPPDQVLSTIRGYLPP